MAKGLKLKVRMFWELTPTFVEVTEKTIRSDSPTLSVMLNKVSTTELLFYFC